MNAPALVQIVGSPIACSEGYSDAWRQTAAWAAGQIQSQFGDAVKVIYYDLFEPDCPPLPADAQLPVVLMNDQVLINGGKISVPLIRKKLIEMGIQMKLKAAVHNSDLGHDKTTDF